MYMPIPRVIDSISLLVWTVDSTGELTDINRWARLYSGLGLTEAGSWYQLLALDDVAAVESALFTLSRDRLGLDVHARLRRHDGELRWHCLHLQLADGAEGTNATVSVVAVDVHECKLAWQLYEQSEARLLSAFEAAQIGAWEWDLGTGTARVTPVVCRLYNIEEAERTVPLSLLWQKVRSDDRERFSDEVTAGIARGAPFEVDFPISTDSGATKWLRMRAHAQAQSESAGSLVFGVTFDISTVRAAEASVRQSERRYRELARAAGALVWSADANGEMQPIEGEWESFTGLPTDRLVGHGWMDLVHPADRDSLSKTWRQALRELGPRDTTFRMRRQDGAYRTMYARAVPLCDERGGLHEWFGTTIDVTERRRAQAISDARNIRLAVATKAASITIVTLDLGSYVLSIEAPSRGGSVASPTSNTEMSYADAMAHVRAEDRPVLEQAITRLTANQEDSVSFEVRVLVSGEEHWMNGSAALQRGQDGSADVIVASVSDTSARKRMELALLDADRRKDEFLAMLAHELRNPLAPLRTVVTLLRRGSSAGDPQELIATMDRQISHLTRLVDDLLEVSRITQGRIVLKREPILIGTVVYGAVESVAPQVQEQKQTLTVDVPRDTVWVCGDATRMAQILVNILNNACKYTPEGGRIGIHASADQEFVSVVIADTGAGISPDLLPRIFDLFSQGERTLDRAKGGLGIGLSLVRKLVKMHEGSIHIESAGPGRGTTVTLRFPRMSPQVQPSHATETRDASAHRPVSLRILIVDDNRDAADSLSLVCEAEGHLSCVCYASNEALERSSSFNADVALLDIGLPEMDGYELAGRLRSKGQKTPVLIAITGYGQAEDRLKAQTAGFDHHFVKPVDINALLLLLQTCGPKTNSQPN
ncbi:PAS domain S-box protein [Caballeronia sp. LZ016]|uniref:PAS domain-containing hybrid sensor histidine kinase/response regulator n=1 Tax=Caballeronia sp. LZ016 TaxID=3038554 RepID=UPI0028570CAE|nr:PAS domain S-box protein [Caballeronia sp. LZ016]MDR5737641.1 PAS domain S-box protein [Caballeronia sp. LZ016]